MSCPRAADVLAILLDSFNAGDVNGVRNSLMPDVYVSDDLPGAPRYDSLGRPNGAGEAYLLERMKAGERFNDITITPGSSPDVAGVSMTRTETTTTLYVKGKAVTSLVYPDCVALATLVLVSRVTALP
ncbi:MAG: hypothetical protein M3082_21705 [Candidatus Dormibacteraeota bacterium]|nr:hypothetical protein [Candidatus Dormibacteraeota bacterium]